MEYEDLERLHGQLTQELVSLENNPKEAVKVKIKISENKTQMLKMIYKEDELRASMNAKSLIELVDNMPSVPMHETGFKPLDFALGGGIEIGTFIQLSGESGVGKTKLLVDMVCNVAQGHKAVFFNGEMGKRRIVARLKSKRLNEKQLLNIEIDSETRELSDIIDEVELHFRAGYKFFMYDSKMKITIKGVQDEIKKDAIIGQKLSELCQKHDLIFILINQMNNLDIKEKRLQIKGGGSQKYDSDIILFYTKEDNGQRTLICTKNRTGNEDLFAVDLILDANGNTVGKNDSQAPIETVFEYEQTPINNNNYEDNIKVDIPII